MNESIGYECPVDFLCFTIELRLKIIVNLDDKIKSVGISREIGC